MASDLWINVAWTAAVLLPVGLGVVPLVPPEPRRALVARFGSFVRNVLNCWGELLSTPEDRRAGAASPRARAPRSDSGHDDGDGSSSDGSDTGVDADGAMWTLTERNVWWMERCWWSLGPLVLLWACGLYAYSLVSMWSGAGGVLYGGVKAPEFGKEMGDVVSHRGTDEMYAAMGSIFGRLYWVAHCTNTAIHTVFLFMPRLWMCYGVIRDEPQDFKGSMWTACKSIGVLWTMPVLTVAGMAVSCWQVRRKKDLYEIVAEEYRMLRLFPDCILPLLTLIPPMAVSVMMNRDLRWVHERVNDAIDIDNSDTLAGQRGSLPEMSPDVPLMSPEQRRLLRQAEEYVQRARLHWGLMSLSSLLLGILAMAFATVCLFCSVLSNYRDAPLFIATNLLPSPAILFGQFYVIAHYNEMIFDIQNRNFLIEVDLSINRSRLTFTLQLPGYGKVTFTWGSFAALVLSSTASLGAPGVRSIISRFMVA